MCSGKTDSNDGYHDITEPVIGMFALIPAVSCGQVLDTDAEDSHATTGHTRATVRLPSAWPLTTACPDNSNRWLWEPVLDANLHQR